MVHDLERVAVGQGVGSLGVRDLHPQAPTADEQGEREPDQTLGEPGCEAEDPVQVAKTAEAADQRGPGTGQRGDVNPVAGVVLQVPQVHQGGLAEVVQGQVEVTDLGRDRPADE
jgi:hypothetical protein